MTGAIAASLASMVVAYSIGPERLETHRDELQAMASRLSATQELMLGLADDDAKAYAELNGLWRLPKDDQHRLRAWPGALDAAIRVPRSIMESALDLLRHVEPLVAICNEHLLSDLASSAAIAEAAARAAGQNVRVNANMHKDTTRRSDLLDEVLRAADEARALSSRIERACAERASGAGA